MLISYDICASEICESQNQDFNKVTKVKLLNILCNS